MHWLDQLSTRFVLTRAANRFFQDGWGDEDLIDRYLGIADSVPADVDLDLAWERLAGDEDVEVFAGEFDSHLDDLPDGTRRAQALALLPAGECRGVALWMGAWNEHDFRGRRPLAQRLAHAGYGSVMLETPFFGKRRPLDDPLHGIATVADFFRMGRGAVEEARSLLAALHKEGLAPFGRTGTVPLAVAGVSMGGNLGAFVSATVGFPIATCVVAGSHSPGPTFLDGLLRGGIDWEALGGENGAAGRLRAALDGLSVLNFPPPNHAPAAVLVAGRGDGYIPTDAVRALHEHWEGSELRWVSEGHATLLWLRRPTIARATVDAFERLARL